MHTLATFGLLLALLLVTAYDKHCVMLDPWEKPGFYHHSVLYPAFSLFRLLLAIVTYFAAYQAWQLPGALVAVALQFAVGALVLRHGFRKRVAVWYPHYERLLRSEIQDDGSHLSDDEVRRQALDFGRAAAKRAMRNER